MNEQQRKDALRLADSLQLAENLSGRMQAIEFLRDLAADPVVEPVGWLIHRAGVASFLTREGSQAANYTRDPRWTVEPLYTHPPQDTAQAINDFLSRQQPMPPDIAAVVGEKWHTLYVEDDPAPPQDTALRDENERLHDEVESLRDAEIRLAARYTALREENERLREENTKLRDAECMDLLTIAHMDGAYMERKRWDALREAAQALVNFRNSGADVDHDWESWDVHFERLRGVLEEK